MKKSIIKIDIFIIVALVLLPVLTYAQPAQVNAVAPPVEQKLVREGDFALKLEGALGLEKSMDEVGAETRLGELGIAPRNGWIADYPVTPDILGELQDAVGAASDGGKVPLQKAEALKRLGSVATGQNLDINPYTVENTNENLPVDASAYPDPTAINNYYSDEGPPLVTYYSPPPDYYYLYAWVPFPFWCSGFWFPGYFILHDFHRSVFFGHRVAFISNHFNDLNAHRVFRVDPVARFNGRTFAGIGVANRRGFISTGVPRSESRIFNGPRTWGGPGGRTTGSFNRGSTIAPSWHRAKSATSPYRGKRSAATVSRGGRQSGFGSRGGGLQERGSRR